MDPDVIDALKKVTLILAFAIILVWLIYNFFVKKQGRADFGGILYATMIVVLIAGYPGVVGLGKDLGAAIGGIFDSSGEKVVKEYFDAADQRMEEMGEDLGWRDIGEKIGLMAYFSISSICRVLEFLFDEARDLMLDLITFIFPLMFAMSLYDSHRGKLSFTFGWTLQICLWSATWIMGASVAESVILGISNPEYLTIAEAVAAAFLWVVFIPIYSLGGIIVIQKLYTLGTQGASSSLGIGNAMSGAATVLRMVPGGAAAGMALSAMSKGRESLNNSTPGQAINNGPKAAGQKVREGASKLLSSVRSGGVIKPVTSAPKGGGGVPPMRMKQRAS